MTLLDSEPSNIPADDRSIVVDVTPLRESNIREKQKNE